MRDILGNDSNRSFNQPVEHVEHVGQQMRDTTELDNLKDDIRRNLKGEKVKMPWQTGRPLRSAGMSESGEPITPLAALNLHEAVPTDVADRFARELQRAALHDSISEGCLDRAEAMGVPLVVQETWDEAQERHLKELAEQEAKDEGTH